MTDKVWREMLYLFDDNERRIKSLPASEPMPSAELCRDSAHRTLGHLTACQSAWLPLLQKIYGGKPSAPVPIHPNILFARLGLSTMPWAMLLGQYEADRKEWRKILAQIDVRKEVLTAKRSWTTQELIRRLVEHERRHLDDLLTTLSHKES